MFSRVQFFNPLNAELNPICHLLALLRAHHIFHVCGLRVNFVLKCAFYMHFALDTASFKYILAHFSKTKSHIYIFANCLHNFYFILQIILTST